MTRVARLFFIIAFMSAAGNCSIELAEKEADTKAMGRQLTEAYYSCVRTSFASQRPTMVDRNMAIDQAFMVCKTEESKLQALSRSPRPKLYGECKADHYDVMAQNIIHVRCRPIGAR